MSVLLTRKINFAGFSLLCALSSEVCRFGRAVEAATFRQSRMRRIDGPFGAGIPKRERKLRANTETPGGRAAIATTGATHRLGSHRLSVERIVPGSRRSAHRIKRH